MTAIKESVDVVVVGGGLAGLTCAIGLAKQGIRGVLLERDAILGGRAASWHDRTTGDPIHIGPHIFLQDYRNIRRLFEELGTWDDIVWTKDDLIMVEGQRQLRTRFTDLPPPLHFKPVDDDSLSTRDVLSNVPVSLLVLLLNENDFLELDTINARAFLRMMGVTQAYIDRVWSFVSMSLMNVPIDLCSAGALMRFHLFIMGRNGFTVGFAREGLGDLFAPQAAAKLRDLGWDVRMQEEVRGFTGDADRATGVALRDGRVIEARHCVASVPPHVLHTMLRPEWVSRHESFQQLVHFLPCPYLSTYIWFDRKLTDLQFWARSYAPQDLNCDFYDLSNINPAWKDRPSIITANCIYSHRAEHLSDEELVQGTIRELAEFLPEARQAKVQHSVVHRIPMAIHCPFPGMEQRRLPTTTPVQGLHLAGDWIRTGLPSSMESAVRSGWLAAEAVLERMQRPVQLAAPKLELQGISSVINRASQRLRRLLPFQPAPPAW